QRREAAKKAIADLCASAPQRLYVSSEGGVGNAPPPPPTLAPMAKKKTAKRTRGRVLAPPEPPPAADTSAAVRMGLDEVVGQPGAIGTLDRALGSGRIHHAWIFSGPEGVGKLTTALALAAIL